MRSTSCKFQSRLKIIFSHLFNVLSCCRGRKRHFKHDSKCQVGSYVEHSVLCGEGTKSIRMTNVTIRMTRQVNLFHMLKVLCCRVEGGKLNMAQDKSK